MKLEEKLHAKEVEMNEIQARTQVTVNSVVVYVNFLIIATDCFLSSFDILLISSCITVIC